LNGKHSDKKKNLWLPADYPNAGCLGWARWSCSLPSSFWCPLFVGDDLGHAQVSQLVYMKGFSSLLRKLLGEPLLNSALYNCCLRILNVQVSDVQAMAGLHFLTAFYFKQNGDLQLPSWRTKSSITLYMEQLAFPSFHQSKSNHYLVESIKTFNSSYRCGFHYFPVSPKIHCYSPQTFFCYSEWVDDEKTIWEKPSQFYSIHLAYAYDHWHMTFLLTTKHKKLSLGKRWPKQCMHIWINV
jgi:hypothetical protein